VNLKRILIVTPYYEPVKGGITTFAVKLKSEFEQRGKTVLVITNHGRSNEGVISFETHKLMFILKTYRSIRRFKPEVIQAFNHWYILAPGIIHKVLSPSTKVYFTYNTEILEKVGWIKRNIICWLLSRCDCVTFVSRYLMTQIESKFAVKTEKRIIYDGASLDPVVLDEQINEFRERIGITPDIGPVFCAISVFSYKLKVEGLKRLIEAMTDLVTIHPNTRLIIVGDGQFRGDLEKHIRKLGLEKYVVLTGYLDNVFLPLAISDIYVHITLQEAGVADTILEAWAVEKSVIAANVGGIPEVVSDRLDGWLIEPTKESISSAMVDLLKEPETMVKLGKEGRKTLERRYSWNKIASDFITLYEVV
jgi:glycosyltransferase involved in cell wall biosynthesis